MLSASFGIFEPFSRYDVIHFYLAGMQWFSLA